MFKPLEHGQRAPGLAFEAACDLRGAPSYPRPHASARARRYEPRMDLNLQIRTVREVSLMVDPEHPTTITQRSFDEKRSQSAVPNVPRAKRIVENLNAKRREKALTWKGVLALAQTSEADRARTIDTQGR
jgi:hypothetical protein